MRYRMPSYYNEFKCIADKCPATCCAGWGIVIDDKTMAKYKKLSDVERTYVMAHIDEEEGMYRRCDGRCSFLNSKNLCDLYIELGEEMFCKTCRRYPRHFEEYGNLIEAALSMSCPVAAEMIINRKESDSYKVRKLESKYDSKRCKEVEGPLLSGLLAARMHLFEISNDRSQTLSMRVRRMLQFGEKIQKLVYQYEKLGNKVKQPKTVAEFLLKIDMLCKKESLYGDKKQLTQDLDIKTGKLRQLSLSAQTQMKQYMDMLLGLENINEDWPKLVEEVKTTLYENIDAESYRSLKQSFREYMESRNYEYEHILNYFIYTYFLGSVYDYNCQAMLKFSVLSTLVIEELGFVYWLTHGRELPVEEQVRLCYTYSRQIEHSDDNVMALEGILNAHPKFCSREIAKLV